MNHNWYKLDKNGIPVRLPDGTYPSGSLADQFHLQTTIGDCSVSTIFLGLDHNHSGGHPILFETMVFGDKCSEYENFQQRYFTKKEAEEGHRMMVLKIRGLVDLLKKL